MWRTPARRLIPLLGLVLVASSSTSPRTPAGANTRPNVVLIVTDDQRWDELENMPNVQSLLAEKGVTYTRSFEPDSLCCPSRTTILTGQFPNHTGVWGNAYPNGGFKSFISHEGQTISVWLHHAGYRTGLIGKYLNQFSVNSASSSTNPTGLLARPGWDYWTSFINSTSGGAEPPAYYNYHLDLGATRSSPGALTYLGDPTKPSSACASFGTCYSTTVLGEQAVSFINRTPTSKPFFLYYAPYGPHSPFTPAPRDVNSLPDCAGGQTPPGCYQPMTVSSNCPPQNGLPPYCSENIGKGGRNEVSWVRALTTSGTGFNTGNRKLQERTLLEADRQVGAIVRAVAARKQLSNTIFIFTSDNSLSGGSHRWTAKDTGWDEAIHLPLIVRYDPVTRAIGGSVNSHVVLDADIVPTLLALTGAASPSGYTFDGKVLPPFSTSSSRTAFPLEHLSQGSDPPTFCGVRTTPRFQEGSVSGSWAYMRYQNLGGTGYPRYEEELYNLEADPWELHNLAGIPADSTALETLKAEARRLCSPPPPSGFSWKVPVVAGFGPASGSVGQRVRLTGDGFRGVTKVTFNGVEQPWFVIASDAEIQTRVPAGARSGRICVTARSGRGCSSVSFVVA
jgi:N-acetylglucosamine-6-sulfatase